MKIKCLVIDDEAPAIHLLEEYISRIPFLEHVKSFSNAIEPIGFLKENPVDLIFLDIEMDGLSGINFINTLKVKPEIILTTAYSSYAIDAFSLNVTDYLLKPISFERFIQAVDKVISKKSITTVDQKSSFKKDYFFVKADYKMKRIDFNDILFIEGMKEYLRIHTTVEKIMTLMSFRSMEELLPNDNFIRTHKSYIVAINKIQSIEKNRIYINKEIIPIGESYREGFYRHLKNNQLL